MSLGEAFQNILHGPTGNAILGLLILLAVDVATGITRALRSGAFKWTWLDAFARSKLTRVVNVIILLAAGELAPDFVIGDINLNVLALTGMATAAAVAATLVASIGVNLKDEADKVPDGVTTPAVVVPDMP